jgi:3-hydroxybutyryl-CoA dehydrogenase
MKIENLNKLLIIGAGTLGTRIGLQASISGFQVNIYDIDAKALDRSKELGAYLVKHLNKNRLQEVGPDVLERISWMQDKDKSVEDVDLISESVVEDLPVKLKVWEEFGEICDEKTLFTTNTSYLIPSMMAEASGRPAKFCAFHFHDVFHARVVDIMPHPGTDPEFVNLLMDLGKRLNQIPVLVKKENPGYIFNSMLMAVLGSAGKLAISGISSVEDIDRSWMGNFNMPIGPFGILDEIGLDTAWHVSKNQKDSASRRFADFLKSYIDKGKLGVKSGEGFYTYPNPAFKNPDFLER